MPDWAVKLLHQIVNTKKAWQLIFGIVCMVWFWPVAMELSVSRKMAPELAATFFAIFSLCIGIVVVDILTFTSSKTFKIFRAYTEKVEIAQENRKIIENFKLAIPELPHDQLIILLTLKNQEKKLNSKTGGVVWLESAGYIKRQVRLEADSYIYCINAAVKSELEAYLKFRQEQEKKLNKA